MDIIITLIGFFLSLVPLAIIAIKIGEKLDKWFDNHFPNVEE